MRIALATQLFVAAVIFAGADVVAMLFGADDVSLTATFTRVSALSIAG